MKNFFEYTEDAAVLSFTVIESVDNKVRSAITMMDCDIEYYDDRVALIDEKDNTLYLYFEDEQEAVDPDEWVFSSANYKLHILKL